MTADEVALANLLSDYCWYVDRLHVEAVLDLFTEDARFDLGHGRVYTGHDELRGLYERLDGYAATSHHVTNPRIEVTGDQASMRSGVYAHHRRHDGSTMTLWGAYLDTAVREEGRWRLRERAIRASMEEGGRPDQGRDAHFERLPRG